MNIVLSELTDDDNYVEYCLLLKQLTNIDVEKINLESFRQHLNIIKSNPFHKIIIAKSDNKIIGTTTILIEPKFIHDISYVAHIEDVVVDQTFRSGGIGRLLMEYAINYSKENNCYKIILDCADSKIGFYEKFNFNVKENHMALYI
jgi:glucosamine-phosphate N-acetyltransferase